MPPSDFANQVPAFDILGAAYVVRDAAHLDRIFKSEVGDTFRKLAREKLDVVILAPAYYGVRHLNLKGKQEDQYAAGPRRREAAHARRRELAIPWAFDRRESGDGRLFGNLRGPANRCRGCAGESAAERQDHEVLRGHQSDRADRPQRRLRPAGDGRQGVRLAHCRISSGASSMRRRSRLRGAARNTSSRSRNSSPSSSPPAWMCTRRTSRPSGPTRNSSTCSLRCRRAGRRECSRRSTRCNVCDPDNG